jgi:hypothetical protein
MGNRPEQTNAIRPISITLDFLSRMLEELLSVVSLSQASAFERGGFAVTERPILSWGERA